MMRKILYSLMLLAAFATGASAAQYTTVVELQRGEKWWALPHAGYMQPSGIPFVASTADHFGSSSVLLSNTGRYIYSADPLEIEFDGEKFTIGSDSGKVEVQTGGKTLREAYVVCCLKNFPPGSILPDESLFTMPLYHTSFTDGYGQNEVVEYAERLLAEGFPAGIIVMCDGWQKVNGSYGFDPDVYPDPKMVTDRLHELGFKVMLTVTPYVPAWGKVYADAKKNGRITSEEHYGHSVAGGVLDMGDDEQFERIKAGYERIRATFGFDGYKLDFFDNKYFPGNEKALANANSLIDGNAFIAFTPVVKAPFAPYVSEIAGDKRDDLIRNLILSGLMGLPYVRTSEKYMTNIAAQSTMADFLLVESVMPVVSVVVAPWNIFDPKLYQGMKEAINFRVSIADYVRKLVADSGKSGEPIVRHMEYQFPKQGFADCDDQLMLGPKYLIAPNMGDNNKRMVRLPKGTWADRDGNRLKGPVVKEYDCSDGRLLRFELVR